MSLGLDIGQRVDPTAICVAEEDRRQEDGREVVHYVVRHLERLPLGTPYPAVAARVAAIVATVAKRTQAQPVLYVDATGVGLPVVDLMRDARMAARITPCWFNHGDRRTCERGEITIGKAFLVSRLQTLLQTARVHLPRTAEAEVLAGELLTYEIKVSENGADTYGAFKVGTHDDLATALGLAVQGNPRPQWRVLA